MTTDAIQLLRDHWSEVPIAEEETVRRAYAYATRSTPRHFWSGILPRAGSMSFSVPHPRLVLTLVTCIAAGAAASAFLLAVPQGHAPRSASLLPSVGGPGLAPLQIPTTVAGVAEANALLPFEVVLPSSATPTSMGVFKQSSQLLAYFNTPADGPYELVESPTSETVADLEQLADQWRAGPIHEMVVVDGVHVVVQGWSDGSLVASWIRGDGTTPVLSWVAGPEDATHGQIAGQTFSEQQALSIAADIIGQGG